MRPGRSDADLLSDYLRLTVHWRHEIRRAVSEAEVDMIESQLRMEMPWIHRQEEWIVGYRILPTGHDEIAQLRATRIRESNGLAFEAVTSRPDYKRFDLKELERSVRSVLADLGSSTSGLAAGDDPDELADG
jgi:hypothetical protein